MNKYKLINGTIWLHKSRPNPPDHDRDWENGEYDRAIEQFNIDLHEWRHRANYPTTEALEKKLKEGEIYIRGIDFEVKNNKADIIVVNNKSGG